MIRTGQTIENPVTGEKLTFHKTSRDTNGEYVVVETVLRPGSQVAAAHIHPYQTERFEIQEGKIGMKVGRRRRSRQRPARPSPSTRGRRTSSGTPARARHASPAP